MDSESKPTSPPIAYDAYQQLAPYYASGIDTKPHNAYYERPAMVAMWPDLAGKRVLDGGCGPGVYNQLLSQRDANVTSVDVSDRMLECARSRLGEAADLRLMDLSQPLDTFADQEFDFVNASLCLDYIEDWQGLFGEFYRVLKPDGIVQFSCGHPAFEAEYYDTTDYFSTEPVDATWTGFGKRVVMPSFRRPLQGMLEPPIQAGFHILQVKEPLPTEEFKKSDPIRYARLCHRPSFICIQVQKMPRREF